jgi:hypothetical protein
MTTRRTIVGKPPEVGRKFTQKFKDKVVTMTVVKTDEGIGYEVKGEVFRSPSMAAKHVSGHEANGYEYWRMEPRRPR